MSTSLINKLHGNHQGTMEPLNDITILVAEDERPVRMLLRVVLEAAGARVLEAEHGETALRLLALHPEVDVLCTDINMPVMDGVGLARRARLRRPDLPIVVCTAMDVEAAYPVLLGLLDATVQKPFIPADLVRAIRSALHRRDQRRTAAAS